MSLEHPKETQVLGSLLLCPRKHSKATFPPALFSFAQWPLYTPLEKHSFIGSPKLNHFLEGLVSSSHCPRPVSQTHLSPEFPCRQRPIRLLDHILTAGTKSINKSKAVTVLQLLCSTLHRNCYHISLQNSSWKEVLNQPSLVPPLVPANSSITMDRNRRQSHCHSLLSLCFIPSDHEFKEWLHFIAVLWLMKNPMSNPVRHLMDRTPHQSSATAQAKEQLKSWGAKVWDPTGHSQNSRAQVWSKLGSNNQKQVLKSIRRY